MAVIRSLGIGNGRKSAGMLTYRVVRGRTIASQRIVTNTSDTPKQRTQRNYFGNANRAMLFMLGWIENAFEKSKYGSPRNNFMKTNKYLDLWAETLPELESGSIGLMTFMLYGFEPFDVQTPQGTLKTPGYRKVCVGSAGGCVPEYGAAVAKSELPSDINSTVLRSKVEFTFPGGMSASRVTFSAISIADGRAPIISDFDENNRPDDTATGILFKTNQQTGLIERLVFGDSGQDYIDEQAIIIPVVRIDDKIVSCECAVLTNKVVTEP